MSGKGRGEHSASNGKAGGRPEGSKSATTLAKEAAEAKSLYEEGVTAERLTREMALHTFANVQDLFDPHGNLKPIHTLTREQAASIASIEVIKKNAEAGDGKTDIVHKVRVVDKLKTLEMLARVLAMFQDRVDVTGKLDTVMTLQQARDQLAKRGR